MYYTYIQTRAQRFGGIVRRMRYIRHTGWNGQNLSKNYDVLANMAASGTQFSCPIGIGGFVYESCLE